MAFPSSVPSALESLEINTSTWTLSHLNPEYPSVIDLPAVAKCIAVDSCARRGIVGVCYSYPSSADDKGLTICRGAIDPKDRYFPHSCGITVILDTNTTPLDDFQTELTSAAEREQYCNRLLKVNVKLFASGNMNIAGIQNKTQIEPVWSIIATAYQKLGQIITAPIKWGSWGTIHTTWDGLLKSPTGQTLGHSTTEPQIFQLLSRQLVSFVQFPIYCINHSKVKDQHQQLNKDGYLVEKHLTRGPNGRAQQTVWDLNGVLSGWLWAPEWHPNMYFDDRHCKQGSKILYPLNFEDATINFNLEQQPVRDLGRGLEGMSTQKVCPHPKAFPLTDKDSPVWRCSMIHARTRLQNFHSSQTLDTSKLRNWILGRYLIGSLATLSDQGKLDFYLRCSLDSRDYHRKDFGWESCETKKDCCCQRVSLQIFTSGKVIICGYHEPSIGEQVCNFLDYAVAEASSNHLIKSSSSSNSKSPPIVPSSLT